MGVEGKEGRQGNRQTNSINFGVGFFFFVRKVWEGSGGSGEMA